MTHIALSNWFALLSQEKSRQPITCMGNVFKAYLLYRKSIAIHKDEMLSCSLYILQSNHLLECLLNAGINNTSVGILQILAITM